MLTARSQVGFAYEQRTAWMITSDDTPLRTELYLPSVGGQVPAVLIRTPYSEPMQRNIPVKPLIESGFAVVIQYCRGAFGSEGQLIAFEAETADGLEAIEWVRSQEWCDGRIAMMGSSYLGMTQNAVAWKRPLGLVAMVQAMTTHDYRNGLVYQQGAFQLGQGIGWHQLKTIQTLQDQQAQGDSNSQDFIRFARLTSDPASLYEQLPLEDRDVISDTLPSWQRWIHAENDPDYWASFNFAGKQHLTEAPALHIGGWYDLFLRGTLGNYLAMTSDKAQPEVADKQRLIIGPWTHTDRSGSVGYQSFPSGSENAINLENIQISYIRSILDGEVPDLPPVTYYVMGANEWRTAQEWPLPEAKLQDWYLEANGQITERQSLHHAEFSMISDPANPVPTVGGNTLIHSGPESSSQFEPGVRDRSILDQRDDILRWASEPLDRDVDLIGPIVATLWTSADAVDADIAVHLSSIEPNGRVVNLVDGYLRLKYRNGMDLPEPLEANEPVEAKVDLGATARRITAGSRLRLEIAGSDFPAFDRNSGTGLPIAEVQSSDLRPIQQTIYCGPDYPSRITLPVIPHP